MHREPFALSPFFQPPNPQTPNSNSPKPPMHSTAAVEQQDEGPTNGAGGNIKKEKHCTTPIPFKKETSCDRGRSASWWLACYIPSDGHNFRSFSFCECMRTGCILSCPRPNLPWQPEAITCCGTKPSCLPPHYRICICRQAILESKKRIILDVSVMYPLGMEGRGLTHASGQGNHHAQSSAASSATPWQLHV